MTHICKRLLTIRSTFKNKIGLYECGDCKKLWSVTGKDPNVIVRDVTHLKTPKHLKPKEK